MSGMFSRDSVRHYLIEIFSRFSESDDHPVTEGSHITGDLGIDSINIMEIIAELEDRFDLTIPDEALPAIQTVGDAIRAVVDRLSAAGRLS